MRRLAEFCLFLYSDIALLGASSEKKTSWVKNKAFAIISRSAKSVGNFLGYNNVQK